MLLNNNLFFKIVRWHFCCLIFFISSCDSNKNTNDWVITATDSANTIKKNEQAFLQIDSLKKLIKTGDLVVRNGNDFTSESLKSLNQRSKKYSHCGIASIENDSVFVYHALGGEWNPDEKICRDYISVFATPISNRGTGLYRFNLTPNEIYNTITVVQQLKAMGVTFDMKFDLKTNNKMYCAEFVYKSYQLGTNNKLHFATSHIGNFEFIGVDDIFLHPNCTPVAEIVYK